MSRTDAGSKYAVNPAPINRVQVNRPRITITKNVPGNDYNPETPDVPIWRDSGLVCCYRVLG